MEKQKSTTYNNRQLLFVKYTLFVLIDLMVLGFFNQYWDLVFIETFTVALLAAMLLQFLMQVAIKIEHMVADQFFGGKTDARSKVLRGVSAWALIFVSKLVILEAINISFGKSFIFGGPMDGLIAFLTVVVVIIIAEQSVAWVSRSLADADPIDFAGKSKIFPEEI